MDFIDSIILGIVQGLTEFLPVSSSGHLALLGAIMDVQDEAGLGFALALHTGTVLSTIVIFRKELLQLIVGFFKFKYNWETQFVFKIFVSMIPVFIVGMTMRDFVEDLFVGNMVIVGVMLLVTASLLWFSTVKKQGTKEIGYKEAFIIGIAQAFAVLPGLSRSGSTITTGMLIGVKRDNIAKFSFLMVLIPILGASFLDIVSGDASEGISVSIWLVLTGFLTSFVVGVLACKLMIKLVQNGNLRWFAYYCLIVGVITIIMA